MKRCSSHVVIVTYKFNEGLVERVKALLAYVNNTVITVVDNSPSKYKQRLNLRLRLKCISPDVIYIDHNVNSRFIAYNVGLKTCTSRYVMFRTDDDSYNEHAAFNIIATGFSHDFVFTPYLFEDTYQNPTGSNRPIESVIFKRGFLNTLLPFVDEPSDDWRLLGDAFKCGHYVYNNKILLNKVAHGRSEVIV